MSVRVGLLIVVGDQRFGCMVHKMVKVEKVHGVLPQLCRQGLEVARDIDRHGSVVVPLGTREVLLHLASNGIGRSDVVLNGGAPESLEDGMGIIVLPQIQILETSINAIVCRDFRQAQRCPRIDRPLGGWCVLPADWARRARQERVD